MILLAGRSTQLKWNMRLIFPSILFTKNQLTQFKVAEHSFAGGQQ